jgi:hypothetical protein
MHLSVPLRIVQAGNVEPVSEWSISRNERQSEGPFWADMICGMSLGDVIALGGRTTQLKMACEIEESTSIQNDKGAIHNVKVLTNQLLPGTITPGRPHIVYVEGDQKINVDGAMSVGEFAKANTGNYLVVTVEVQ